jgi:hypothetical protein
MMLGVLPLCVLGRSVPFRTNAERRHYMPRQRHRVLNSAVYDAALRQRSSLTVWFTDAAISAWKAEPRTTRGGQLRYSPLTITVALTLRAVFRLALRGEEGKAECVWPMPLDMPVEQSKPGVQLRLIEDDGYAVARAKPGSRKHRQPETASDGSYLTIGSSGRCSTRVEV